MQEVNSRERESVGSSPRRVLATTARALGTSAKAAGDASDRCAASPFDDSDSAALGASSVAMDGYTLLRPSLARPMAVAASLAFTGSYVGVVRLRTRPALTTQLYIFSASRVGSKRAVDEYGRPMDRNHPKVVRRRLWSVAGSSVASVVGVWALARYSNVIPASVRDSHSQKLRR